MPAKKLTEQPYRITTNNRFWILGFSLIAAIAAWVWVWVLIPAGELRLIRLQQTYGFFGIIFLYTALITTPLGKVWTNIPNRSGFFHARRAIGVSAFFFSLLHAMISFFGQLGSFAGLQFLSPRYNLALILGGIGLLVLLAMAATSFDRVIDRMGFQRWKKIHRLIYIGGIAIMIHVIMLGTHYAYGASLIARITFLALLVLLMLEAIRLDRVLKEKFKTLQHFDVASMVILHLLFLGVGFLIGKQGANLPSLGSPHGGHVDSQGHEQYTAFEPVAEVNGQTIRINQKQISRLALVDGNQIVQFTVSPRFTTDITTSCFMVNQQNFSFVQGFTKNYPDRIDCLPIGDANPPQIGHYALYLRITQGNTTSTTPFSFEVTK